MNDSSKFLQQQKYSSKHDHQVSILMVPFPLQGHLNQLLHLSRLLSSHNLPVHYVGTATHNHQARRRVHGWDPQSNHNITFHEFPSSQYSSKTLPRPNPDSLIQFPSHLQPLFDATSLLRYPVTRLLRRLCAVNRRVIVIHDSLMGSVIQDFVKFPNAESYTFHSVSAFMMFFFFWENMGRPFPINEEILEKLPSMEGCFTPEFLKFVRNQHAYMNLNSGRIYNTCRVVEGPLLELLGKKEISGMKKQFALGPFNPLTTSSSHDHDKKLLSLDSGYTSRHRCLKWLDGQGRNSVILVSFGTTTTLSRNQIKELAIGLERSEQRFIWVLRDADSGDFSSNDQGSVDYMIELSLGFEERVKERGIVVRDWAPQLEILGHSAIGGFLTHCGWNSCMESISMGVPIGAWPMHSDQPRNAVLMTQVLGIGVVVKEWEKRNEIVRGSIVESCVRILMVSKEGDEMRRRAEQLSVSIKKASEEGGEIRLELDSFISHITRYI